MLRTAFSSSLALAGLALALSGTASAAGTTVKVTLWDKGTAAPMMTGLGMGMDGDHPSKHPMGLKLSTSTVKAGEVTFAVQNSSSEFVHEMIVMPVRNQAKPFPYVADENPDRRGRGRAYGRGVRARSGRVGCSHTAAQARHLCSDLQYAGHYMNGMWSLLKMMG